MLQALYNAVISSSVDDEEDEDALKLLAELLAEEGVDPNAGDEALWSNVRLSVVCGSSCFMTNMPLLLPSTHNGSCVPRPTAGGVHSAYPSLHVSEHL